MRKIPTLFVRDPDDRAHVLPEVTPGCEWALNGEGKATRKWDGTCVQILHGTLWKRREIKPGQESPAGFIPSDHDDITGKSFGWLRVDPQDPNDRYIVEAYWTSLPADAEAFGDGTYEAVGPKINGNNDGLERHELRLHGDTVIEGWKPDSYVMVARAVTRLSWEGVVFHHPDGRMCKIKRKDFAT